MDDFSYQGRFRDLRSLMVRNGRGLSKIAGSLAHNTYRVGIEAVGLVFVFNNVIYNIDDFAPDTSY